MTDDDARRIVAEHRKASVINPESLQKFCIRAWRDAGRPTDEERWCQAMQAAYPLTVGVWAKVYPLFIEYWGLVSRWPPETELRDVLYHAVETTVPHFTVDERLRLTD